MIIETPPCPLSPQPTILQGAFAKSFWWAFSACSGIVLGAAYLLWLYQRTFFGEIKLAINRNLPDVTQRERLALFPLVALALIMGLFSPYWMKAIDPSSVRVVEAAQAPKVHATVHPEDSSLKLVSNRNSENTNRK